MCARAAALPRLHARVPLVLLAYALLLPRACHGQYSSVLYAGNAGGSAGHVDGPLLSATLSSSGPMAVAPNGTLYIGDSNYLRAIAAGASVTTTVLTMPASGTSTDSNFGALCVDPANGALYGVNLAGNLYQLFGGGWLFIASGMQAPAGCAVDTMGNVLVTLICNIVRVVPSTGASTNLLNGNCATVNGLSPSTAKATAPAGIAVIPSTGDILFCDRASYGGSGFVRRINSQTSMTTTARPPFRPLSFLTPGLRHSCRGTHSSPLRTAYARRCLA